MCNCDILLTLKSQSDRSILRTTSTEGVRNSIRYYIRMTRYYLSNITQENYYLICRLTHEKSVASTSYVRSTENSYRQRTDTSSHFTLLAPTRTNNSKMRQTAVKFIQRSRCCEKLSTSSNRLSTFPRVMMSTNAASAVPSVKDLIIKLTVVDPSGARRKISGVVGE